jgi:hypothetical protein
VDYATKGLASSYVVPSGALVSPKGHIEAAGRFGVRGKHPFGAADGFAFIYQLETQLDISAPPSGAARERIGALGAAMQLHHRALELPLHDM